MIWLRVPGWGRKVKIRFQKEFQWSVVVLRWIIVRRIEDLTIRISCWLYTQILWRITVTVNIDKSFSSSDQQLIPSQLGTGETDFLISVNVFVISYMSSYWLLLSFEWGAFHDTRWWWWRYYHLQAGFVGKYLESFDVERSKLSFVAIHWLDYAQASWEL